MKLSEFDIDTIMDAAGKCYDNAKSYAPAYRKQYFMDDLVTVLKQKSAGWQIGACTACAGTGYTLHVAHEGQITDGYGSYWSKTCPMCGQDTMEVVRPGKVQCGRCG